MIAGIAQIKPIFGDLYRNIEKHLSYIKLARENGADLIIFPEMSLTGYYLKDLTSELAIGPDFSILKPIFSASKDIDIVVSFPERDEAFNYYITSVYLRNQNIINLHRKVYPPINGMFDDLKDFKRGETFRVFSNEFLNCGMLICRDMWHAEAVTALAFKGAKLIIVPSAVPLRSISESGPSIKGFIERSVKFYAEHFSLYFAFVNRVGFEEGVCFYGGSTVASPSGEIILSMCLLEEEIKFFELNKREIERRINTLPLQFEEKRDLLKDG
ncbi:MAG: hypothetical protein PHR42_01060 [Caldisericia bacterium]|nr:hypothetical protein [Caldisericia bacterium]HQG81980.1 nitrilase-related carbon-nitrogen hydrolase [Caldisericia bacterium]